MEKLPYLKEKLQTNIPRLVTIAKRVGQYPETDFKTRQPTGRNQTLYHFHLADGVMTQHYAREREEAVLSLFSAGETLQVVLQEGKNEQTGARYTFPVWTPKDGAEARAAANPQSAGNTRMDSEKRKLDERKDEQEQKSIAISLQGFMQAFIIQGMKMEEALENAVKAREAVMEKASEIQSGIPVFTHDPVTAEAALSAFAADPSPVMHRELNA